MKRMGCINWESAMGGGYFAEHTRRTLTAFPERTPYYATRDADGLHFPKRTAEDFDRELQYAMQAGVDFFAHCWYAGAPVTDAQYNPGSENIGAYIHELSAARILHQKSALREKIKLCAIIAAYEMGDGDYAFLADAMQETYYEKTGDGRPLVFVFDALTDAAAMAIRQLKNQTDARGIKPYLVGMINTPAETMSEADRHIIAEFDALSAYAQTSENITSNTEFYSDMLRIQSDRAALGKPIVPLFSLGWNPMPRVKSPVPWVSYGDIDYAPTPGADEITMGAAQLSDWVREHADLCDPDFLLTFAWNEFEEGGWLCPTKGSDGKPDLRRLDAYRKAMESMK